MKNKVLIIISLVLLVSLGGGVTLFIYGKPVKIDRNMDLDFVLDDEIKEVLNYASLAPSSHNSQSWYVTVSPEKCEINIFVDAERVLTVIDSDKREAYISIGAFLGNLTEALKIYGYRVNLVIDDNQNDLLCAVLTYEKLPYPVKDINSTDIFIRRHTNKSAYKTIPIPEDVINGLINNHTPYLGYFPAESDDGQYLSKTTLAAFTQQANNQNARDELSVWLRFSNPEAKEKKDGLPAEQLGLTGIIKTLYYLTTNRESSKGDTFADQGIQTTKKQLDDCAGFFVITGYDGKGGWIESGMQMQAFWLDAVRHDIAIQPMSAALGESPFREELVDRYGAGDKIQMILRAGLVDDYGENAIIRRDLNEFIYLD